MSKAPERIWIDGNCVPSDESEAGTYYIDGPEQDVETIEYVRADLTSAWQVDE